MARRRLSRWISVPVLVVAVIALGVGGGAAAEPKPFLRDLAFPTNLAFAPDGRLFFTEKSTGNVRIVDRGELLPDPFVTIPVVPDAERGLLGIAIAPDFAEDPWVYLYLSDATDGINRLVRVRAEGDRGGSPQVLLEGLDSAAGYHNGGDLAFGLDGTLFVTIGEAHDPERAQDVRDVGGKIVRLNPDGSIPADNPFGPEEPAWSYGHRNSFGICVDPDTGELWETENGPDVNDEVNLIRSGTNYGWPLVTGRSGDGRFEDPVVVFPDTVALTGCAVVDGAVYFGAYDGRLWRLSADRRDSGDPDQVASFDAGVTDVVLGPDGLLYVATADAIWRISPQGSSDQSPTQTPASPVEAPPPSSVSAPPTEAANDEGSGARPWIAAVALAVLAVGLILRFAAGRRLGRRG